MNQLENWLLEQGGPAIHLRLSGGANKDAISALLDMEEVHAILDYFDGFNTQERDKKTLEHLVHYFKEPCIYFYFPFVADLGFRAGVPVFDEKMEYVAEIFRYLDAYAAEYEYCYYHPIMLHCFFFIAGYTYPEVIASLEQRLDAIHTSAKERIFDIYQDDSKLRKKPQSWADVGVLKDELNPFSKFVEKPLPTVYDIRALAYYQDMCSSPDKRAKINDIIAYILEPKFQEIREGYGILWVKDKRIYQACGWSPTLPLYKTPNNPAHVLYGLLDYLPFMSKFEIARQSKWFADCLQYLDQYKTESGTYLFPKEYLHKKYVDKAYLSEANMALKRNERDLLKREIVSTMKMVEIMGA